MDILFLWIFSAVIGGFVGLAIGDLNGKNNGGNGFLLGALLGPIGWIIVAVLPPNNQESSATTQQPDAARIARLEAELAALKQKAQPPDAKSSKPLMPKTGNIANDGEIPTYRLD